MASGKVNGRKVALESAASCSGFQVSFSREQEAVLSQNDVVDKIDEALEADDNEERTWRVYKKDLTAICAHT